MTRKPPAPRRDYQQEALDALCDVSLSEVDAVRQFQKLMRRQKPVARAFLLGCGLMMRDKKASA